MLTEVKALRAADTTTAQAKWDEAFGYLSIPANYDSSVVYANTDVNRPLLWGGYLRERGREIQAGGTIFSAFLKGRAAIGGYDVTVRNAQATLSLTNGNNFLQEPGGFIQQCQPLPLMLACLEHSYMPWVKVQVLSMLSNTGHQPANLPLLITKS